MSYEGNGKDGTRGVNGRSLCMPDSPGAEGAIICVVEGGNEL